MRRCFTVMAVVSLALCLAIGTQVRAADNLLLSDSFNTVADPGLLNDDLATRQSGSWAPTTWTAAGNGSLGAATSGGQLALGGTGSSWQAAYLDNPGAALIGTQYTISATMDHSGIVSGHPMGMTVKNSQGSDIAAGAGALFFDIENDSPTVAAWELLNNTGSGMHGVNGTITPKSTYAVQLVVDETGATNMATVIVDGVTLGSTDWSPGANANRYIGLSAHMSSSVSGVGKWDAFSVTQAVPEPSTVVLLVTGLLGLLCYAWRKR
jgi:hypothetical protein